MSKPKLVIEIHDIEVADVMSELSTDYWPGARMIDESIRRASDEEISFAVDVLVPVL